MNSSFIVDTVTGDEFCVPRRFSHRGQTRHFAFMAYSFESQGLGCPAIHLAEAVLLGGSHNHVLAAIENFESIFGEMAVAVMHCVAASVRGDEEVICPRAIENRWECVGLVMIVEACNDVRPKAAVPLKGANVKQSCDVRCAVPKDFRHEL